MGENEMSDRNVEDIMDKRRSKKLMKKYNNGNNVSDNIWSKTDRLFKLHVIN